MTRPTVEENRSDGHFRLDAGGTVRALEVGTLGTVASGVLTAVAVANSLPVVVVAGLPILVGIGSALVGYAMGAKDKS